MAEHSSVYVYVYMCESTEFVCTCVCLLVCACDCVWMAWCVRGYICSGVHGAGWLGPAALLLVWQQTWGLRASVPRPGDSLWVVRRLERDGDKAQASGSDRRAETELRKMLLRWDRLAGGWVAEEGLKVNRSWSKLSLRHLRCMCRSLRDISESGPWEQSPGSPHLTGGPKGWNRLGGGM